MRVTLAQIGQSVIEMIDDGEPCPLCGERDDDCLVARYLEQLRLPQAPETEAEHAGCCGELFDAAIDIRAGEWRR